MSDVSHEVQNPNFSDLRCCEQAATGWETRASVDMM